jgi:hypothetical protein
MPLRQICSSTKSLKAGTDYANDPGLSVLGNFYESFDDRLEKITVETVQHFWPVELKPGDAGFLFDKQQ